jgi:hypothetical protein
MDINTLGIRSISDAEEPTKGGFICATRSPAQGCAGYHDYGSVPRKRTTGYSRKDYVATARIRSLNDIKSQRDFFGWLSGAPFKILRDPKTMIKSFIRFPGTLEDLCCWL